MTDEREQVQPAHSDAIQGEKDVAWFTAALGAWLENRMERDRAILQLSVVGLGFVATMVLTAPPPSIWLLLLDLLTGVGFLATILLVLQVFKENAVYLQECIKPAPSKPSGRVLDLLDHAVNVGFLLSLLATFATVAVRAVLRYLSTTNEA